MKARLFGKHTLAARGVSTLEILIAFAMLTLTLTAAILVVFGNQSISIDTQLNVEALSRAEERLEYTRAQAKQDFPPIASHTTEAAGSITYTKDVTVEDTTDPDTKKVTSLVSWLSGGRSLLVKLVTLLTNPNAANSCTLAYADPARWHAPQTTAWEFVKDLIPTWPPSNNFIIEDMAVYKSHLYVVGGAFQGSGPGSFLVAFKTTSDPTIAPVYKSDIELTPSLAPNAEMNLPQGIEVNGDYAYIANGRSFCTNKPDCAQLIVADISDVDTQPLTSADLKYFPIPNANGSQGIGRSIYYANGILYLGLTKCPNTGCSEFNVIDVGGGSMGGSPTNPKLMGSFRTGAAVSGIIVSGNYAYVTTSDNSTGKALMVLDLTNLSSPKWSNIFGSSFGVMSSIAASANPLYVGLTYNTTNPEFYIVKNDAPETTKPSVLGPGISLSGTNGIQSLVVRGALAFLVTTTDFEIWNISNPSAIVQWASPITYDGGGSGTAAGCTGNVIYVGSRPSAADKAHLATFYPAKEAQTITVTTHAPATVAYNSSFSVAATANSGLPVAITVSGVCSLAGSTVTMTSGSGTCSVRYNQAGNYNYSAAIQVTETVTATKADQTISFAALPDKTYGDANFTVSATASSGLAPTFAASGNCTISGSIVHITGAGSCTLTSSQGGSSNYNAAPDVQQTFTIQKASSVTLVSCPASVVYNGAAQTPCSATATGAGGLNQSVPVTYTNNTNVGTAGASASYVGSTNYLPSNDSDSFQITAAFDYSLSNNAPVAGITIARKSSGTITITRTLVSGSPTPISLSVTSGAPSVPAQTDFTFNSPTSCSPTCSSTLTISPKNPAPTGTFTITITGSPNGTGVRTTSFKLIITP